jgi:TonB family protein
MSGALTLTLAALFLLQESPASSPQVTRPKPLAGTERIVYPAQAKEQAIVGPVRFRIRVSAQGTVEAVEVLQVPEAGLGFEEAVRNAVGRWRFEPARSGDVVVPLTVETQIRFQLVPEEERAIDDVLGRFQRAWNEGRLAAMIAELDSDELLQGRNTPSWLALAPGLLDWLTARRAADPALLLLDLLSIKFMWTDLVKVELHFERPALSPDAIPLKGPVTSYLRKDGGRWRILRFGSLPFTLARPAQHLLPTAPARADSPEILRTGGEIKSPRKIHHVSPHYPDEAKRKGKQGTVVLECTVDREGKITEVVPMFGPPELAPAAEEAVRQWRYTPTLLNGVAVPVIMTVTVNFRLSR